MNRLLADLAACGASAFPTSPFWVPRRFRVVRMHSGDNRVELQPCVRSLGLPEILPVDVWPGMAGLKAALTPGAEVLVQFVDGDPGQPVITHFAPPDAQGFVPVNLYLQAGSTGASPTEHATSIEAVVNLLNHVLLLLGAAVTPPIAPPAVVAILQTAIGTAGTPLLGNIADYATEISTALSTKLPNTTGLIPGVGWPCVRGG